MDSYKNTLPGETDDHPDSGMPRQLRTQADDEQPLDAAEASAAGLGRNPTTVYGEDELEPNADDRRDSYRGSEA